MTAMSYQQRTALVTLVSFVAILGYYVINLVPHVLHDTVTKANLTGLWITTVVAAIFVTVAGLIVTQIIVTSIQAVKEGEEAAESDADATDERDRQIDLLGTGTAYRFHSTGVTIAMVLYLIGQPAEIMFALLIFFGLLAQIAGDTRRLILYRKGV